MPINLITINKEDLKDYIDKRQKELIRKIGFKDVTPTEREKKQGPTTVTGTISFLGNGEVEQIKARAKEWADKQCSQMKKDK